ncbi:HlyD family type I secretion periplasmic adaptor subunit [Pseudoalteromonas luteoviolacea]|uniref:Membrane fusion protein (MFP) family protein n=1 Tax=Pseudoalteromonas luteoviolacea S4054 TaxID=1129367 RepID=A0A0F6AFD7_9GAMM|nr:HlyD family type I secretion periplasmic adaptor subunit [Pseudoalteromonas luteoviolacea]AOT10043.1 hypothetical protein S4054249_20480 [Pseudoalteromonas luteoviolacea]AOT14954.1 hypothetical protein S40542_20450 [Pseudoalteromonas luteoviolacea]AOT19870.1 hypothetical protein S4054_20455 [Pseudoalteromonas luteoviolacea]KKE84873.1 hypothetical protein N479_07185 [Pseudoalteromonas luteoviolacea S4054]KZN72490.1 hypothetical protein N481_14775 [Pseudoalteromonas luteoviolacea S4047-1]
MSTKQNIAGSKHIRLGWTVIALSLGIFLVWGAFAPLDKGVVVDGQVAVSGHKKQIQAPQHGVISALLVQNGQWVDQDEPLLVLDSKVAKSQLAAATTQYYMALAEKERLDAELQDAKQLLYSDVLTNVHLPQAKQAMALNQQLFEQRRAALHTQLQLMQDTKHTTQSRIEGLEHVVASHKQRADVYENWVNDTQALVKKGFQSQEQLYQLKAQAAEIRADLANAHSELLSQQARLLELDTQHQQTLKGYRQEVSQQRAKNQSSISDFKQRMTAAQFSLDNSEIRAPVAGQVIGLDAFGDVVSQSQLLMEIVPKGQRLIVNARIPSNLIDSVALGQDVDLLFSAFNTSTTPKVKGQVERLAQDTINDERTGQPYYQVAIRVNQDALTEKLVLQPGMPVQAFVKNGERPMLSYLLKPLTDRIPNAMADI